MGQASRRSFDTRLLQGGGRLANRVMEPVPACWFCPSLDGGRSNEHVFPRWLLKALGAERESFAPIRFTSDGRIGSQRREFPATSLTAGNVCALCNNGWMSQLEHAAKPLILGMLEGKWLSSEESEVLARWFAKTAAALNVSQPYRLLWDTERRHALKRGIPEGVVVGLTKIKEPTGGDKLNWLQGPPSAWLFPEPCSPDWQARLAEMTHQISIQVDSLVGTVLLPAREISGKAKPEIQFQPIWPETPRRLRLQDLPPVHDLWDHRVLWTVEPSPLFRTQQSRETGPTWRKSVPRSLVTEPLAWRPDD